jgi:hypothetical protein
MSRLSLPFRRGVAAELAQLLRWTKLRSTTRAASGRALHRHASQRPAWGARGAGLAQCARSSSRQALRLFWKLGATMGGARLERATSCL